MSEGRGRASRALLAHGGCRCARRRRRRVRRRRVEQLGGGGRRARTRRSPIGLITKTESNPFFVKMKEGAQAQAKKDNVKLLTASGKSDTDNASQVTALENMTTQGAKMILLVPADSKAVVPADQEGARRGRHRDRARHADRAAGRGRRAVRDRQPEGRRADRPVREGEGQGDGHQPKIAMLDLAPGISVGPAPPRRLPEGLRHQGGRPADRRRRPDPRRSAAKGQARWRRCSRRTRASTSSTRSTSRPGSAARPRSRRPARTRRTSSSCPSTAAATRSSAASRPA